MQVQTSGQFQNVFTHVENVHNVLRFHCIICNVFASSKTDVAEIFTSMF